MVVYLKGKEIRMRKVQVRLWVAIFFLFNKNALSNRSKIFKCLKSGSDRLRKGNLLRRPIAKSLVCTKRRETLFPRNVSLFKDSLVKSTQQAERSERLQELEERENAVLIKEMAAQKTNTKRALDLATEKGSSASLTVLSIR